MKLISGLLMFLLGAVVLAGCSKPALRCTSPEDSAEHHYLAGMELLEKKDSAGSAAKFERALYCDEGYGPAHAGLAILGALKAAGSKDAARRSETDNAIEHLRLSAKGASTPESEFAYRVASMRVHTALKWPAKWLREVESDYKYAMKLKLDERKLLYYDTRESAQYFMGAAYLEANEFQSAKDSFSRVLAARKDGKWASFADKGWKRADKIVRALAGITVGDIGKKIALMETVDRAQMAALLADELKTDKLFAGRIPVSSQSPSSKQGFVPIDMVDSPFRDEALSLIKWNVRGFEPVYDANTKAYLFRPNETVKRGELAMALEDVLIKITGDEQLSKAFMGHAKSPFPDVAPTSVWYNSVMNMTTRNIMETELSGEFRPDQPVDGAEALLAIRVLRQRLNIY